MFKFTTQSIMLRDVAVLIALELAIFYLLNTFSFQERSLLNAITYLPMFLLLQSIAPGFLLLTPFIPLDQIPLPFPITILLAFFVVLIIALFHWRLLIYLTHHVVRTRSFFAIVSLFAELGLTSFGAVSLALT